jgi:hypothetical protein
MLIAQLVSGGGRRAVRGEGDSVAIESRRFAARILDQEQRLVGESRMWACGVRGEDGWWNGWLHVADTGGPLPPGRYAVEGTGGWQGELEITGRPPARVFETDLLAFEGLGPPPWPDAPDGAADSPERARLTGTPWQGSRGIPPFKQEGDRGIRSPAGGRDGPPAAHRGELDLLSHG